MSRTFTGLVLLLAVGCGGRSVDEFCKARFDALIARDIRCGVAADVASASWQPYEEYLCKNVAQLQRDKKVVYDSAKGDLCLTNLAKLACGPLYTIPDDPCDQAISGLVTVGNACYTGIECAGGSLCANDSCPGTCSPLAAVGDACGGLVRCAEGAACVTGLCVTQGSLGASCRVGSLDCESDLFCASAAPIQSTPGTCKAIAAQSDGACSQVLACVFGTVCSGVDYSKNTPGTCQPVIADGSACAATSDCGADSWCNAGTCQSRPRIGEACGTLTGGAASCLLGWCQFPAGSVSGTCADFLASGAACTAVDSCGPVARCDQGSCVALCSAP
jgi:hypothetical protein